ncbi:MAG: hypothetical protein JWM53_3484, partial [bacterium]|nr:hypothetical protein [bacterium]
EVLRINERWITEVVERFGVCPFAQPAMKAGAVARRVVREPERARALIDELAGDDKIDVALLIFPSVTMSAQEFNGWCAPLRAANPAFVAAVFHPETPYDLATPAQAVGFFRRAPDPTLQLVRVSTLDAVRGTAGGKFMFDFSASAWAELARREHKLPTSDRIARDNHALIVRDGVSTLQSIYDDIRADRERSYRAAAQ